MGLAVAVLRSSLQDSLAARGGLAGFFVNEEELILFCEEKAGSDGVDTDAWAVFLGHVDSEPFGEIFDGGLGGGVGGDAGERAEGVHGGDVDDNTMLAFSHVAAEDLAGEHRADDIKLKDLVEGIGIEVKEGLTGAGGGAGMIAACAVDKNVNRAELFADGGMGGLECGAFEDIGSEADGAASAAFCYVFGSVFRFIEHGHTGAMFGEGDGHDGTQHATAAGDDGDFAV